MNANISAKQMHMLKYSTISMIIAPLIQTLITFNDQATAAQLIFSLAQSVFNILILFFIFNFKYYRVAVWIFLPNPVLVFEFNCYSGNYISALAELMTLSLVLSLNILICNKNVTTVCFTTGALLVYSFIRVCMIEEFSDRHCIYSLIIGFIFISIIAHTLYALLSTVHKNTKYYKHIVKLYKIMPISIIITSKDGRTVKESNICAQQELGISATNVNSQIIHQLFFVNSKDIEHPSIKFTKYQNKVLAYGCLELPAFDGCVMVFVINITEIFNTEENYLRKNLQWLYTNTANHQLRTPLSIIEGMISLLQEEQLSDEGKRRIEVVRISLMNLRHILDDTLILNDSKSLAFNYKRCNVEDLLTNLSTIFNIEAEQKNISFIIEKKSDLPILISDTEKLNHVLYTLLQNAFKYTNIGKITLSTAYEEGHLSFSVKDSGIGMNKNEASSLYKIFSNSEYLRSAHKVGSGIGLYVVNSIISSMGGVLVFRTKHGVGTEFSFKIKTSKIFSPSSTIKDSKLEEKKVSADLKILAVDDNTFNVMYLKSILKKLGFSCDTASNGKEAVDMHRLHDYSLILMDINMPVMNGIEASKIISTEASTMHQKKPPVIIAVTAQNEPSNDKEFKSSGILRWATKPITITALKDLILELCN